ncbi:hypothetical protein [Gallibacterium anatis]|uniref:hypothetical protein n=1 Tax=Gallibacterium anatis TaxID=750 RepID=UPI001558D29D|nr:hypothetical protein [Gallibacterium anatis]
MTRPIVKLSTVLIDKLPLPSKFPEPLTAPVKEIFLAVCNLLALTALAFLSSLVFAVLAAELAALSASTPLS